MITMKVPNRYRKISKKRFNHAGKALFTHQFGILL